MVCIYCRSATQVKNSRLQKQANSIWRRRHCTACNAVFTTHEEAELAGSFVVTTAKKHMEPFKRDRLFMSIYESCGHRKEALDDASGLTRTIVNAILPMARDGAIDRAVISAVSREVLARFDTTASTVYAAYHPLPNYPSG